MDVTTLLHTCDMFGDGIESDVLMGLWEKGHEQIVFFFLVVPGLFYS